jgi:hypothetical protein
MPDGLHAHSSADDLAAAAGLASRRSAPPPVGEEPAKPTLIEVDMGEYRITAPCSNLPTATYIDCLFGMVTEEDQDESGELIRGE